MIFPDFATAGAYGQYLAKNIIQPPFKLGNFH